MGAEENKLVKKDFKGFSSYSTYKCYKNPLDCCEDILNLPRFAISKKLIVLSKDNEISVSSFCEIMQYSRIGKVKIVRFEGYYMEEPCIISVEYDIEKISILLSNVEYINIIQDKLEKRNSFDYSE